MYIYNVINANGASKIKQETNFAKNVKNTDAPPICLCKVFWVHRDACL